MRPLGWPGVLRLGLVQTALGMLVMVMGATLNRVMVVEHGLPELLPGALLGFYFALGALRPRWGHGSDRTGRTMWILGGMAALAVGAVAASAGTALMGSMLTAGIVLAAIGFALVGVGSGAAGTAVLALLAARVAPERRSAAATTVWLMMIVGFIVAGIGAGALLDPFSGPRLIAVTAGLAVVALALSAVAVVGMEPRRVVEERRPSEPLAPVLRAILAEPEARRFTLFVFVSMLAYQSQDPILEPFAARFFGMTVGESTTLSATHQSGVLIGMILAAILGSGITGRIVGRAAPLLRPVAPLGTLAALGCAGSGVALAGLAAASYAPAWPFVPTVLALGLANGVFATGAIGAMMALAGGVEGREGARMGVWGAAQAIASSLALVVGAGAVWLLRIATGDLALSYALVFGGGAILFLTAALLAAGAPAPARAVLVPGE